MSTSYYLAVVLGFFSVALFCEGVWLAWLAYKGPEATRLERRLLALSAGHATPAAALMRTRLMADAPLLTRWLQKLPRIHDLDRLLLQSGLPWSVAVLLVLVLCVAVVLGVLAWLAGLPWWAVVGLAAVGGLLPFGQVLRARRLRMAAIERQLPDALDLMARAMLAGHAFPGAVRMVADELPEPLAGEFAIVFAEINYGIPVAEALTNLTRRVPSGDLRYFVLSVLIQRETGGNLGELLQSIAALIRNRLKLLGTVRVLSAEGRVSANILTALPFVLATVIQLINPGFLSVLWTEPMGRSIVAAALLAMVAGVLWMRRVIHIHI
jgi:tight adherence protein B